jgi:hypothetical protein
MERQLAKLTKDEHLELRALREGWGVTPEMKQQLVKKAMDIALHGGTERDCLRAMRTLMVADELDQKRAEAESGHHESRIGVVLVEAAGESAAITALKSTHHSRQSRSVIAAPQEQADGSGRDSAG